MKFGMFFLGEYVNMFTVSALATTLFLGGWQAPPPLTLINDGMLNHGWWGLLWFTLKLWGFMFFFVWVRGTLPRTRYDHFMAPPPETFRRGRDLFAGETVHRTVS